MTPGLLAFHTGGFLFQAMSEAATKAGYVDGPFEAAGEVNGHPVIIAQAEPDGGRNGTIWYWPQNRRYHRYSNGCWVLLPIHQIPESVRRFCE